MHDDVRALVDEIDAFLATYNMSASAFGGQALNDLSFVKDVRSGKREPKVSTMERVRKFMAEYRPAQKTKGGPSQAAVA